MDWKELLEKANNYGLSFGDAHVSNVVINGWRLAGISSELVRNFGEGARSILLRGAVSVGKYVDRMIMEDFGFEKKFQNIGRLQDLVTWSVLMLHNVEYNSAIKLTVTDCPFVPMVVLTNDPISCEICIGYLRGAVDLITEGEAGASRITHIPAGDANCTFLVEIGKPHGFTSYKFSTSLPSADYLSGLIDRCVEKVEREAVPFVAANCKRLKGSTDSERHYEAYTYILKLSSMVLGGLAMNQGYTAYTLLGGGLASRITSEAGKGAADVVLNGVPPLFEGWKRAYNIGSGPESVQKALTLYAASTSLEGEVSQESFRVTRCPWYDMLNGMLREPKYYAITSLSGEELRAAIKCGCASCSSCVMRLVENTGLNARQTKCMADGEAECVWSITP
ncbi:MAG: hypothetical protein QXX87_04945 [Candidatus Jordarchaeales archaeon]